MRILYSPETEPGAGGAPLPEPEGQTPTETPEPKGAPPEPVAPDPLAGYSEQERADIEWAEGQLASMGPAQRAGVLATALRADTPKEPEPAEPPAAPPKSKDKAPTADDQVAKLQARIDAIEQTGKQQQQAEKQKADVAEWEGRYDAVLAADEDLRDVPDEQERIKAAFAGTLLRRLGKQGAAGMPRDVIGAFREFVSREKARDTKLRSSGNKGYVDDKLKAAHDTAGEAGSGGTAGREVPKASADRWRSKDTLERVKKELGEA